MKSIVGYFVFSAVVSGYMRMTANDPRYYQKGRKMSDNIRQFIPLPNEILVINKKIFEIPDDDDPEDFNEYTLEEENEFRQQEKRILENERKLREKLRILKEQKPANVNKKSKNFQIVDKFPHNFDNVGGYEPIKQELRQLIDIMTNYSKYTQYNVRIPKGLLLEGPPGNGKTLIAKAFAGECNISFIAVSGSQFQEKYVGVGSTRIRELFELAKKNKPCIIFIDEIDSIGRSRSEDGETSTSERDSTLNELLVGLDGFNDNSGIFLVASTNRMDLLDSALIRPGRIDKKIHVSNPDEATRRCVIDMHIKGKPYNADTVSISSLVETTEGLSCASIENVLNEAMLHALMNGREMMEMEDIDLIYNKMIAGYGISTIQYTNDAVRRIATHEIGHAIVGLLARNYKDMKKVIINLSSPQNPGYTIFQGGDDSIPTKEYFFDRLCILLAGRISENMFYESESSGAVNDFQMAYELAYKMVTEYGMGKRVIYPKSSEKYREKVDDEVDRLLSIAQEYTTDVLVKYREEIEYYTDLLLTNKNLTRSDFDKHPVYRIKQEDVVRFNSPYDIFF